MEVEKPMKSDIFDRIMSWKLLSPLQPFYKKHKEPLLYLFFGGSHRGRFLLTPPFSCAIIQPFISIVGGNMQCPGKPEN